MTISVVIPALDEAAHITGAVASVVGSGVEVIVVDSGSTDRTQELARALGWCHPLPVARCFSHSSRGASSCFAICIKNRIRSIRKPPSKTIVRDQRIPATRLREFSTKAWTRGVICLIP